VRYGLKKESKDIFSMGDGDAEDDQLPVSKKNQRISSLWMMETQRTINFRSQKRIKEYLLYG